MKPLGCWGKLLGVCPDLLRGQHYWTWIRMLPRGWDHTTTGRDCYCCQSNGIANLTWKYCYVNRWTPLPYYAFLSQSLKLRRQKDKPQGHPGGQLRCWSKLGHEGPVGSSGFAQTVSKDKLAGLQCQRLENLSLRAFSEPSLLYSKSIACHSLLPPPLFSFVLKSCTVSMQGCKFLSGTSSFI